MGIRNNNIELEYQSLFIPATSFTGVGLITGAQGSEVITAVGNGTPELAPVVSGGSDSATGLLGLEVAASDRVQTLLPMPTFIDADSEVYVRCWWVSTAATGTYTPTVTYSQFGDFDAVPLETASKTSLDVAIPADDVDGDNIFHVTDAGTINAGGLSFDDNDALELQVSSAFTTMTSVFFLGLELWYLPKHTPGAQKAKVALPTKVVVAE